MIRRKLAQPITGDLKCAIEPRAHILQRDHRSQLDDRLLIEVTAHIFENLVGHGDAALAHRLGHAQRGLFSIGEQRTGFEIFQRGDFLEADSVRSANGRVDVNSKRTADDLRGAYRHQPLDDFVGAFGKFQRHSGYCESPHDAGPMRLYLQWR